MPGLQASLHSFLLADVLIGGEWYNIGCSQAAWSIKRVSYAVPVPSSPMRRGTGRDGRMHEIANELDPVVVLEAQAID